MVTKTNNNYKKINTMKGLIVFFSLFFNKKIKIVCFGRHDYTNEIPRLPYQIMINDHKQVTIEIQECHTK